MNVRDRTPRHRYRPDLEELLGLTPEALDEAHWEMRAAFDLFALSIMESEGLDPDEPRPEDLPIIKAANAHGRWLDDKC
jgi:hypothetical protein